MHSENLFGFFRSFFAFAWTRPSTNNFYKITQSCSFSAASPEHTNYNLLGRRVVDRPYNRRNVNGQRHSNLPSSTTRVFTEFNEISVDTYPESLTVPQSSADTGRCIQNGMECSMSRDISREAMVKGQTVVTHKCVRCEAVKLALLTFNKQKYFKAVHF